MEIHSITYQDILNEEAAKQQTANPPTPNTRSFTEEHAVAPGMSQMRWRANATLENRALK